MIALKYSDIPTYLHDSSFYQSLDSEDESSVIELPELCYKATDSVEDVAELEHMLHVAKYWGLNSLSLGPIKFCFENLDVAWPVVSAFENTHPDFATLFEGGVKRVLINAIKINKKDEIVRYIAMKINCGSQRNGAVIAAAAVGRLDFIQMMHKLDFVWNSDANLAAARAGHLECLKYLRENALGHMYYDTQCAEAAARNGHVECLRYLHTNNEISMHPNPEIMAITALGGHLECLKLMCELHYKHNRFVTANAAQGGHLDCLKFLRSVGCEWDNLTMARAAEKGHLSCLQYAIENGCPKEPTSMDLAAINGHKECARYLHSEGFLLNPSNIADAAKRGDIETIKLLRELGCLWPENRALGVAVEGGHLVCLQYLVESGCTDGYDGVLFTTAARLGRLDILQYLHSAGRVPGGSYIVFECLEFGHISCLQYLLEIADYELTWKHCSHAIEFGRLDCLKFLRERGVPWDEQAIAAVYYPFDQTAERLDCFIYAITDGCPLPLPQRKDSDDICTALLKYSGFTVEHLKRLREANCPWTAETMRTAALRGYQDCVQYLIDNACPFPEWKNGKQAFRRAMKDPNSTVGGIKCLYLAKCPFDGLFAEDARTAEQRQYLLDCGCPEHNDNDPWSKLTAQPAAIPKPFVPAVLFETLPGSKEDKYRGKKQALIHNIQRVANDTGGLSSSAGAPVTSTASSPPAASFSFGAPPASGTAVAPVTFTASSPPAAPFSFGAPPAGGTAAAPVTLTASSPPAASFSFGAPPAGGTAGAPVTLTASSTPAASFSFGAPPADGTAVSPVTLTAWSPPAASFSFGAPPVGDKAVAPVTFTASSPPAAPFSFGAPPAGGTAGAPVTSTAWSPPAASFSFGAPLAGGTAGAPVTLTASSPPAASFSFGDTAGAPVTFAAPSLPTASFSFGSPSAGVTAVAPGIEAILGTDSANN